MALPVHDRAAGKKDAQQASRYILPAGILGLHRNEHGQEQWPHQEWWKKRKDADCVWHGPVYFMVALFVCMQKGMYLTICVLLVS
jgi:hypothetical protein